MKFNWKTKTFIGGALTLVLLYLGVPNPSVISGAGTAAICELVKCDGA
jgi:hypothetical protein